MMHRGRRVHNRPLPPGNPRLLARTTRPAEAADTVKESERNGQGCRLNGGQMQTNSVTFQAPIEMMNGCIAGLPSDLQSGAANFTAPASGDQVLPQAAHPTPEAMWALANTMPPRMPMADVCPVRALFDFIRSATPMLLRNKSVVGDPQFVQMMYSLLDQVSAKDLGMIPEQDTLCLQNHPVPVGFVRIHLGPEASVGIFVASKGAKISMHDHPDMFVFGRLLFGQIRLTVYTPQEPLLEGGFLASLDMDDIVGPEPANFRLEPVLHNLHELVVIEDFAFLNISLPPYNDSCGRPCTDYTAPHAGLPPGQKAANGERFKLFATKNGGTPAQGMRYYGPPYRPES
mmetsp:Transcript_41610/g.120644  ORF Transcript_41610/g.120644 Transcript_41610/m.120644 type:complete len:344 (+) Transcript_41610:67-1098(+)